MPRASVVRASRMDGGSAGEADTAPEALHLVAGQLAPLAGREAAGVEARVADALEPAHRMADRFAHPPHLAVAALVQRQLDRPRAHAPNLRRCRHAVVELDARLQFFQCALAWVARDLRAVDLLDLVARVREPVR